MLLACVDFVVRAKSAIFLAVLAVTSVGIILSSECSRAEGDGSRFVQPETKKDASKQKLPLPQRPTARKAHDAVPASVSQKVAMAEDKGEPAGQLQPQVHAGNAGITACFDSLARASSRVIDGPHRAFSFWDAKKPDTGTFRSVVALNYGGTISPRGAALIINSPMRDATCDATTVQVVPTARPCSAIQGSLMTKGKAVANLAGLALIQTPGDVSYLLLPTAGDGCTIVSMMVLRGN